MSKHLQTHVQPGGRIEITDPELESGARVDIYVRIETSKVPRALDILADAPGHRLFDSADAVDQHLDAERNQWDD